MRVKYSPEPCARPEITELLKSALLRPGRVAFACPLTAAREVMVLTLIESRRRRCLKRLSAVALVGTARVSRWCKSREIVFSFSFSMFDEVRVWESDESVKGDLLG